MNGFAALDIPTCRRYVVDKAGAANAVPALKYKFYFTPYFGGYTEFGIVPIFPRFCSRFVLQKPIQFIHFHDLWCLFGR